jgi:hypothetical protein
MERRAMTTIAISQMNVFFIISKYKKDKKNQTITKINDESIEKRN